MERYKVGFKYLKYGVIIAIIFTAVGWFAHSYFQDNSDPIIIHDPIVAPPIDINVDNMECDQAKEQLKCYYTAQPELGISFVENNQYLLTAGLCERKWHRTVDIKRNTDYKYMISGGIFVNSQFQLGPEIGFYRFWGRFGIGVNGGYLPKDSKIDHIITQAAWKF